MSVAKDFCVISARMCCEGETCKKWIFTALFSPNVYSCRLIKRGNTFFSPNQRGSEWKTTKGANALKTSLPSRSRLHFNCSRTNFSLSLLQEREGERRIFFLGSTFICLLCPDSANLCVFHLCSHKVPLREHMWEWSVTVRLAALALPLHSCASLHALQWVSLAWTVTLLEGWISLCIWEHCWYFPNTHHKPT